MARQPKMARLDSMFTEAMKNSLLGLQPDLVTNLTNLKDIMDHLVAARVFPDAEDITCLNNRKDQVRNLLLRLPKRPQYAYWTFLSCLYEERIGQGHLAEMILRSYEREGGEIREDIRRLRQDYLDSQRGNMNHPATPPRPPHSQQQQQGRSHPAQASPGPFQPAASGRAPVQRTRPALQNDGLRTESGNYLATESSASGPGAQRQESMETDAGDGGQGRKGDAGTFHLPPPTPAAGGEGQSPYQRERGRNPGAVYRMESTPRGLALIIDNENFDHLGNRTGTSADCQQLKEVLEEVLGFEVITKRDLKAEEMMQDLTDFSRNQRLLDVDSAVVAVLSHGSEGGVIYGVDGKVDSGSPQKGTYILTTKMRDLFTTTCCEALKHKPKLFVLQACRGVMADTEMGVIPLHHLPVDIALDTPRQESVFLDMCTVYSTVEGMVGYRHSFIPHLAQVFREKAATLCLMEMMTELMGAVGRAPIAERSLYVAPECSTVLCKKWYFNPPPS